MIKWIKSALKIFHVSTDKMWSPINKANKPIERGRVKNEWGEMMSFDFHSTKKRTFNRDQHQISATSLEIQQSCNYEEKI